MMMMWVGLQMICIGSLLVQTTSVCLSQDEFLNRTGNLMRRLENKYHVEEAPAPRTCAEAAEQMRGDLKRRALSPWRYRLDQDHDRVPDKISIAECLCEGCIVNGREDYSYNSVPLEDHKLVYRKTKCKGDVNKYKLTKEFIKVSVGCVCVVPRHANTNRISY